jgi:segregation and condensation protein A
MAEFIDNPGTILDIPRLLSSRVQELDQENELFSANSDSFGLSNTLSDLGIDLNSLDISEFETYEPLGILVELVQHRKIDPWDIDIVEVTDVFLRRIEELQKMDLRISSRTLLYSAILLRMKSSGILVVEEEFDEFDPDFPEEVDFPEPEEFPIPKLPVRRVSTRPVTLSELILELKKAEKTLSKKKDKKARQSSLEIYTSEPQLTTGDVLGIAHEEAISARLAVLWGRLLELFSRQHEVVFSKFLESSEDKIMDYLSLLFLASNRKIWLFQKELFSELYIYPGEDSGFSTENNPPFFHTTKSESQS